jgi:hypothetical protein
VRKEIIKGLVITTNVSFKVWVIIVRMIANKITDILKLHGVFENEIYSICFFDIN